MTLALKLADTLDSEAIEEEIAGFKEVKRDGRLQKQEIDGEFEAARK